ncbi:unnamed protein product [Rotaria sp. Silwood2]|nr:unnamed protein product [Rotaria sp. Silwood2]
MERYGRLLEKAMQSQMHEDVPSDCEEWISKKTKDSQSKHFKAASISSLQSPLIQQMQSPPSKEISSKNIAFDGTPSSSGLSLRNEPLPFSRTRESLNTEQESMIHTPAETTSDDDSSYDVEENENSDKEVIIKKIPSSNRTPSATTVTKSKRSFTIQQQIPVSKRLRFSTNDPYEQREYERLNLQQVISTTESSSPSNDELEIQDTEPIITTATTSESLLSNSSVPKTVRDKFFENL